MRQQPQCLVALFKSSGWRVFLTIINALIWATTICLGQETLASARNCDSGIYCKPSAGDMINTPQINVSWNTAPFANSSTIWVSLKAFDTDKDLYSNPFSMEGRPDSTLVNITTQMFDPPPRLNMNVTRKVRFLIRDPEDTNPSLPGPIFTISSKHW